MSVKTKSAPHSERVAEVTGLLDVSLITFHELLEPVPVTSDLALKLAKDRDWKAEGAAKAEEWTQFVGDVRTHGVKEAVWIIEGTTTLVEGRRRVLAVREIGGGEVPFRFCKESEAREVILRSVAMKRVATKESKAYLAVYLHPYVAVRPKGRPSAITLEKSAMTAELTREQLAASAGCSLRTLEEACATFSFMREHPTQRKRLEPLLFEGLIGLGAARAGAAGGNATKGKDRPQAYFAGYSRGLSGFTATFQEWDKWPEEDRAEAVKAMAASISTWPEEIRAALTNALPA